METQNIQYTRDFLSIGISDFSKLRSIIDIGHSISFSKHQKVPPQRTQIFSLKFGRKIICLTSCISRNIKSKKPLILWKDNNKIASTPMFPMFQC